MTSLVENTTTETAERLATFLYYNGEGLATNIDQDSPLYVLDNELWQELCLLPTPPLSPECLSTTDSNTTHDDGNDHDAGADCLLYNMLEYDQMMDVLEEAERALSDSQQSSQQDLLLQDCMWSGVSLGVEESSKATYPNTSSSATVDAETINENTHENAMDVVDDNSIQQLTDKTESDCVEPAIVFPTLRTNEQQLKNVPNLSRTSSSVSRSTGPSSSESEEEIDVVTVERSEHSIKESTVHSRGSSNVHNTRKTSVFTNSPRAANVSGNSPLRKKRHGKRLSRHSSTNDGMDSDDEARRASHNVLERKRRNDLKNSFDVLRMGIPELEENLRAPKVVILRKAVDYIKTLQSAERKIETDFSKEQTRHSKLMQRLTHLRKVSSL